MLARVLALTAGLGGGAVTSQFPEFSQQYYQRLSGAVDELALVIADFDRSATAAGLDREAALAAYEGGEFLERRGEDMSRTIARHERLSAERDRLEGASAWTRLMAVPRAADPRIAERTWTEFRPSVPITTEGLGFGVVGFLLANLASVGIGRLLPRRRAHG
ncbi:MAG: DUF2937 family protein [Pseudomonadota bacterium]